MKTCTNRISAVSLLSALLMLGMLGCETDDDSSNHNVAGSWLYSDTGGRQSTWALVQSDNAAVAGTGTDGEAISGAVSGNSINLILTYSQSNHTASLSGTLAVTNTMTGSYTNSLAGGGWWTAIKRN